jgi:sugar/nucleoside kinase (ribokinase family)
MYDLVTFGDITMDLFFKGENLTFKEDRFQLALGGKYFVNQFHESLGGGGANVAVGAAHFGLTTAVCARVGESVFKQVIVQKLVKKNVSTEFLIHEKNHLNISSILLTGKGERTIINYQTHESDYALNPLMLNHILESKMIFIGNLPDVSISDKLTIMKKCKENDIPIVLNLGVEDCRKDRKDLDLLLELADVCIVNKYEYADMIKKKADGLDLTKDCAKEINFQKKILVITDSSNGSYAYANKGIIKQQALHPKDIIDTTGAGDAFTSGFLAAYIHNESIENAMRQGAEYASEILGRIGAQ